MVYIISRKTSRELRENLAESSTKSTFHGVRGRLRNGEEAVEVGERLRREEGSDDIPVLAVEGDSNDSYIARVDLAMRLPMEEYRKDPERAVREGLV